VPTSASLRPGRKLEENNTKIHSRSRNVQPIPLTKAQDPPLSYPNSACAPHNSLRPDLCILSRRGTANYCIV
jgi:hypothetical protein